jgi:hypothetical protein
MTECSWAIDVLVDAGNAVSPTTSATWPYRLNEQFVTAGQLRDTARIVKGWTPMESYRPETYVAPALTPSSSPLPIRSEIDL